MKVVIVRARTASLRRSPQRRQRLSGCPTNSVLARWHCACAGSHTPHSRSENQARHKMLPFFTPTPVLVKYEGSDLARTASLRRSQQRQLRLSCCSTKPVLARWHCVCVVSNTQHGGSTSYEFDHGQTQGLDKECPHSLSQTKHAQTLCGLYFIFFHFYRCYTH